MLGNLIERFIRWFVVFFTNFLPVKVIRDDKGVPFLYRYHLFSLTNNGPGMCIHHFVKSDPERGYHDHPWNRSISFIMCGRYDERILVDKTSTNYTTHCRNRWTFNYLNGQKTFHRVMIEDGKDAWTIFFFGKRSKTWGMVSLNGEYKPMSVTINDQDGGWWEHVQKGLGLNQHLPQSGKVIATVDIIIHSTKDKILLIKRGKEPYKGLWALPGGRIEQTDNDILAAAYRELLEETNIKDVELTFVKTIGNNHRDPRGFCLTNIFVAKVNEIPTDIRAGDDAVDYTWMDLNNLSQLAFDHKQIIEEINKN